MNRLAIPFRPRYGILFRPRRIEDSPDHRIYVRKKQGPQGLRFGYSPKRSLRSRAAAGTVHASGTNFQL